MTAKTTMKRKTVVRMGRYHVIIGMADDITDECNSLYANTNHRRHRHAPRQPTGLRGR